MKYRREHAVAEGRKIAHRDFGGGLRFNAPGKFEANPYYSFPATGTPIQVPHTSAPGFGNTGGYTAPPDQNTPPSAIMSAMQQPGMAYGGEISSPDPNGWMGNGWNGNGFGANVPVASGGQVDEAAFRHACGLLEGAQRSCGGSVKGYADGGPPHPNPQAERRKSEFASEVKRLLALWDKTEKANPGVHSSTILLG